VAQLRDGRSSQLVVLPGRGAPPRPLTQAPEWFHLKAAFTRDGSRVVFARRPLAGGRHHVASVDLEGGDLRLHASTPESNDQSPAPSPTRDEIALVSDRGGDFDVYLVPVAGGEARQLTHTPEWDEAAPRWSPSGELLALTLEPRADAERAPRGHERLARSRVRVVDREGNVRFDVPGFMPDWMPAW
jgi:Tol biopolymer transport system component